jgi:hypothetical protein
MASAGLATFALLALAVVGCSSSSSSSPGSPTSELQGSMLDGVQDGGTCHYPAGVDPLGDTSTAGCFGEPSGRICSVSNGSTVNEDGSVSGGTASCHSQCGASQYEMVCTSGPVAPSPIPIPDPSASLGCTAIVEPTPSNALFYCCPCAE